MLLLRIRQSEVALGDDRLDEAYALVEAHPMASHRRGQQLIANLAGAFVKRGREHFQTGRYAEALTDCEKAARLNGNHVDVVALRNEVRGAVLAQQQAAQHRQRLLADARRQVDGGRLDVGAQLLSQAPKDASSVVLLSRDIEQRKQSARQSVEAARLSLKQGELHHAARHAADARAANPQDRDLAELLPEIRRQLRQSVQQAIDAGQLQRAQSLLSPLCILDPDGPETRQFQATLSTLQQVWRNIEEGNLTQAGVAISAVTPHLGAAPWLNELREQVESSQQAKVRLQSSPLAGLDGAPRHAITRQPADSAVAAGPSVFQPAHSSLPNQFLLHVDAVGTFLVLRQSRVTIGPISSSVIPDIGLVAEPNLPTLKIERLDDDYFLRSPGMQPAGADPRGKLLNSGDRVELSPRCRLTFALPNPASTSAVLDLSGARLPRSDIRRVILMDEDLVIGPGPAAHVPRAG